MLWKNKMNQLIWGIILLIAGLICTTIGGFVTNDAWTKFKKQPEANSSKREFIENGTWELSV